MFFIVDATALCSALASSVVASCIMRKDRQCLCLWLEICRCQGAWLAEMDVEKGNDHALNDM